MILENNVESSKQRVWKAIVLRKAEHRLPIQKMGQHLQL